MALSETNVAAAEAARTASRKFDKDHPRSVRGALGWKIAVSLALVAAADLLFYRHPIGWTLGGFAFALLVAVAILNRTLLTRRIGRVLFALNIGLCMAMIEHPGALPIFLYVLGLASFVCAHRGSLFRDVFRWAGGLASFAIASPAQLFSDVALIRREFNQGPSKNWIVKAVGSWLIPGAFAIIFILLFSGANPLIAKWLEVFEWRSDWEAPQLKRVLFWFALTMAVWPFIHPRLFYLAQRRLPARGKPPPNQPHASGFDLRSFLFSKEAILRSMIVFNLLFAFQNALDLNYLWAGSALPEGFSFAAYAHRGAYPLIATAILAGVFVLLAFRPGAKASHSHLVQWLMYLWIAQNVLLVLSSIWRTVLYVDVYSLTYLRVAALIWMGLVAAGLIWIVLRFVWDKSNVWLVNANALTLLAALYVASFVNFGAIIADHNVRHSAEVTEGPVHLDLDYLARIGPSALPALRWYILHSGPENSLKADRAVSIADGFERDIKVSNENWRAWTFRGYRTLKSFELTKSSP